MAAVLPQRVFHRPRKRYGTGRAAPKYVASTARFRRRNHEQNRHQSRYRQVDLQQHAKKVRDAMLGIMKKALKEEKEMLLSGFGKFEAFTKKNRKGRNPQTGEEITLDSHDVLAFRISRKFKAAMNSEQ